jgi:hypothetical protein
LPPTAPPDALADACVASDAMAKISVARKGVFLQPNAVFSRRWPAAFRMSQA